MALRISRMRGISGISCSGISGSGDPISVCYYSLRLRRIIKTLEHLCITGSMSTKFKIHSLEGRVAGTISDGQHNG